MAKISGKAHNAELGKLSRRSVTVPVPRPKVNLLKPQGRSGTKTKTPSRSGRQYPGGKR